MHRYRSKVSGAATIVDSLVRVIENNSELESIHILNVDSTESENQQFKSATKS